MAAIRRGVYDSVSRSIWCVSSWPVPFQVGGGADSSVNCSFGTALTSREFRLCSDSVSPGHDQAFS